MTTNQLTICVFCAANDWPKNYTDEIKEFALLLHKRGHRLIYGGSKTGLMNLVATTIQAEGGKVIGVPLTTLVEGVYEKADEIIMTDNLSQRKEVMLSNSDAIIALVGGSGTLDEITDAIELKRHGFHSKPIVALNTNGFYTNLQMHYSRIENEGLLKPHRTDDLIHFADTPQQAIEYCEKVFAVTKDSDILSTENASA